MMKVIVTIQKYCLSHWHCHPMPTDFHNTTFLRQIFQGHIIVTQGLRKMRPKYISKQ